MRRALILACGLVAAPAFAQSPYSLTLLRPLPVGSAGSGWDAANPLYRAYQGMPYVRTIDAIGGTLPYTYTITSDSSGALAVVAGPCTTIGPSCTAGTLTLTNPTTDFTYAVRVTDAVGAVVNSGTISVDVNTNVCDSVGGWCFVDADAGSGGDGSIGSPYDAIADVWNSTNRADRIMVLRGATAEYVVTGMTQTDADDCSGYSPSTALTQVAWDEGTRPVAWMGYPGETPVIDFGFDGSGAGNTGPCMELRGQSIWLQNFEAKNFRSIGFQLNGRFNNFGAYVGQVYMHNLMYGGASANSAFLEWSRSDTSPSLFDTVTMSTFETLLDNINPNPDGAGVKLYGIQSGLIAFCHFEDDPFTEGMLAMKHAWIDGTVVANTFTSLTTGIGGNLNEDPGGTDSSSFIGHNLLQDCGSGAEQGCIAFGVDSLGFDVGEFTFRRNTVVGVIPVESIQSDDGPVSWGTNVIVNAGGSGSSPCPAVRLTCSNISDYSQIVDEGDNLVGPASDGIVDANGDLQGDYLIYLGTRGWQFGASAGESIFPGVRVPLRIMGGAH